MKVSSISSYNYVNQKNNSHNQSFGNAFVTLSKKNLASVIAENVDAYNKGDFAKMFARSKEIANSVIERVNKELGRTNYSDCRIFNADDLVENTDLFVLAAGSGSRFRPMAEAVANLRGKGEEFNKISVPFELRKGQAPLTMLDIPLAMGRFFAKETGYEKIINDKPTGSFGDVIAHYMSGKSKPKDVVVCCGDNVFDEKGENMLEYLIRVINHPGKQLGVVGVARKPQDVANRFGVLDVGTQYPASKLFPLNGFVEKPSLDVAQKLTTPEGVNAANTGMFVIKRETMEKLLKILKCEQDTLGGKTKYIAKNAAEPYDFAAATKWANWLNGSDASDVRMVKRWEDVGEPQAYLSWLQDVKNGRYLSNFTPERQSAIANGVNGRVGKDFIQFSLNPKGSTSVDGINIKA